MTLTRRSVVHCCRALRTASTTFRGELSCAWARIDQPDLRDARRAAQWVATLGLRMLAWAAQGHGHHIRAHVHHTHANSLGLQESLLCKERWSCVCSDQLCSHSRPRRRLVLLEGVCCSASHTISPIHVRLRFSSQRWSAPYCHDPRVSGVQPVAQLTNETTDTHGYVAVDHVNATVYVVFKGTTSTDLQNWITDLEAYGVPDRALDQCNISTFNVHGLKTHHKHDSASTAAEKPPPPPPPNTIMVHDGKCLYALCALCRDPCVTVTAATATHYNYHHN